MTHLYENNPLRHFLLWLAAYLIVSIVAVNIGVNLGLSMPASAALPLGVLTVVLFAYLMRTGIGGQIGLGVPARVPARRMWFYLPLLLLGAVTVSALTFGVGHAASLLIGENLGDTALQILNATVVGLVFTLVVLATGNLHAVIAAHFLYNAIAQIAQPSGVVLILAAVLLLVGYGGWLFYGAGVRDRLRTPVMPA